MKTLEEWVDVHDAEQCMTQSQLESLFARIQADALRYAAKIVSAVAVTEQVERAVYTLENKAKKLEGE